MPGTYCIKTLLLHTRAAWRWLMPAHSLYLVSSYSTPSNLLHRLRKAGREWGKV